MSPPVPSVPFPTDKGAFYEELLTQFEAMLDRSLPQTANLANASALIFHALNDAPNSRQINWCGFYLTDAASAGKKIMYLGPFQGRLACTSIPFGKGVCGTAAASQVTQLVPNVHDFPGHIACDSASESEIVVPIFGSSEGSADGDRTVVGVLDIDCLVLGGFDEVDRAGLERIVRALEKGVFSS